MNGMETFGGRMNKLLVFGCSLSAQGHLKTWSDRVSEVTGLLCVNLAIPASSNQLQIQRFKEYVLDTGIHSTDIIIWEITSTERCYKRVKFDIAQKFIKRFQRDGNILFESNRKNCFDNDYRYDYLCHHPDGIGMHIDEAQLLEDILFFLTIARQFTKNVIVLLGWKEALPKNYYKEFISKLKERNFNFIDSHILEHAIDNHLPLEDDFHPGEEGYISFADNCVIPKLKELKLI
jgi:hypothetical protein